MARESHCFWILQPWLLATMKKPIDSRITLHAAHTAYKKILICTVDTNVVVLAVALARTLTEEIEVWVSISTGSLSVSGQAMRLLGLWVLRKRRHYRCLML